MKIVDIDHIDHAAPSTDSLHMQRVMNFRGYIGRVCVTLYGIHRQEMCVRWLSDLACVSV